jgi:hypothetical protein
MFAEKIAKPRSSDRLPPASKPKGNSSIFATEPLRDSRTTDADNRSASQAISPTSSLPWDFKSLPLFSSSRPDKARFPAPLPIARATRRLQPKLLVGSPNDLYEREAEAVAEKIVGGGSSFGVGQVPAPPAAPSPTVRRKCAACEAGSKPCSACTKEEEEKNPDAVVQRSLEEVVPSPSEAAPPSVQQALRSSGQPLAKATRDFFEPRLGADLSGVRVRTDAAAAASARDVNAAAYTVGQDLVFGAGLYAPDTAVGRHLLAHELTHVVQQSPHVRRTPVGVEELSAVPVVQRAPRQTVMRAELWNNWFEVCKRVQKSRVFKVTKNSLSVTAYGAMRTSKEYEGPKGNVCGKENFNIQLTQVGKLWNSDKEGCEFLSGRDTTRNWVGLEPADYFLTISTQNTNPNCCLDGTMTVSEETNLPGPSCSGGPGADIAGMPVAEKVQRAIEASFPHLGPDTVAYFKALMTPEALAAMAAFTTAYVIAQTTPIGWVADVAVAALIVATVLLVGKEAIDIVKMALDFVDLAKNAKTDEEIEAAGVLFSQILTRTSLDIITAILFHKVAKAANLKPPPRSPGVIEVLQKAGGRVSTFLETPALQAAEVGPKGVLGEVSLGDPNALLSETAKPGETKGGAGTGEAGSGKGSSSGGAEPPKKPAGTFDQLGKQSAGADEQAGKRLKSVVEERRAQEEPKQEQGQKKETGAQQEKRLLNEDRAARPANDATYYSYEGKSSGSFTQWVGNLKTNLGKFFPDATKAPALNEAPLEETAHDFIERHADLKAEWKKMNLPLDEKLSDIQQQRRAAGSDRATVNRLDAIERALVKQREAIAEVEKGKMGSKRPDLVELFFQRERAVVTDITQMTSDPLHNFKTQMYVDLLKDVLGWSDVNGNNFNTISDQNVTP